MPAIMDFCCTSITACILLPLLLTLNPASASPITTPNKINNPLELLQPRSPITTSGFNAEWPVNVVMVGGSQYYGGWVTVNAGWVSMCDTLCLDLPAYAEGDCCGATSNEVAVVAGTGTCDFIGVDGWTATVSDTVHGYTPVGPPQSIISARCYT